jgi:hypothetical protein
MWGGGGVKIYSFTEFIHEKTAHNTFYKDDDIHFLHFNDILPSVQYFSITISSKIFYGLIQYFGRRQTLDRRLTV